MKKGRKKKKKKKTTGYKKGQMFTEHAFLSSTTKRRASYKNNQLFTDMLYSLPGVSLNNFSVEMVELKD